MAGCVFRVRRAGLRLVALLVLFGALLGAAAAGETIL